MLIRNIQELKQNVTVNKNMAWDTIEQSVELAEQRYLLPILDTPQYTDLNADLTANTLDADQTKLLKFCRRVIGSAAMWLKYPTLNVFESDLGIQQTKSREGTSEPAHQWRYQEARSSYLVLLTQAMEDLYIFLQQNKATYLLWANGKGFSEFNSLFFRNNKELGDYLNTADSVRTFISLRPFIALAERKYIAPIVPTAKIDELKAAIRANTVTTNQADEIMRIRQTLAWAAYFESIPHISYEVNTQAITVTVQMDGMTSKRAIDKEERKMLWKSAQDNLQAFSKDLQDFYTVPDPDTTEGGELWQNAYKRDFWVG